MLHEYSGHTEMAHNNIPTPPRREGKTERKQYKFKHSLTTSLDEVVERQGLSETEVVERAIQKEVRAVPLVGEIPCGPMAEIEEEYIESWINVGDLLKTRKGDFLLKARGDSMTGDGIHEGDLVLIRPQDSCDSGEVAAVIVDTAMGPRATLKKVEYNTTNSIVRLLPMNDLHDVVEIDMTKEKLRICGVKRGVIRMH